MPHLKFTQNLQRHISAPPAEVPGATVGEALNRVFDQNPRLRGYVVDEHGRLRKHVVVFINGELIHDRRQLTDPIEASSEVIVMQALSGG
jgi:sulfur carrier protein ThiS